MLLGELLEIIDFAVENHAVSSIPGKHWLVCNRSRVHDGQPCVPKPHLASVEVIQHRKFLVIRTTMLQEVDRSVPGLTAEVVDATDYATHTAPSFANFRQNAMVSLARRSGEKSFALAAAARPRV